ncbi:MAG: hypothetical protein EBZ48_06160 [Proteobacteria bacterium]|nr:hypothetical protein [Pseudomonadota bacterium]
MPTPQPISRESVKQFIERSLEMEGNLGGFTLAQLRELREQGLLNKNQIRDLDALEKGIQETSEVLFKILKGSLGAESDTLDREAIKAGLALQSIETQRRLLGLLPPDLAAELQRKLSGSPEQQAEALGRLAEVMDNALTDRAGLIRFLDVLITDPRNEHLRGVYGDTKAILDKLDLYGAELFKDVVRRQISHKFESLIDQLSRTGGVGDGGHRPITSSKIDEEAVKKSAGNDAQAERGAVDQALRTLTERLDELRARIARGEWTLASAPASESFDLTIKLRQDQVDGDRVASEIHELQRRRSAA